ncbi:MAG: hypothetical protein ACE5Z5_05845 [Candidatus Bathyarchaeia archaeon]
MHEEEFIPSITVRENLSLPLVFRAIDKEIRDEKIAGMLSERSLTGVADKYPRYLTPEEYGKVSGLRKELWEAHPQLGRFLKALEKDEDARACLPLLQHGLFATMSNELRRAVEAIGAEDFDRAAHVLSEVIDVLALRAALTPLFEVPSLRVLEVSLLVVRSYYNILKYRTKVNKALLREADKRVVPHLRALAESFSEIGRALR